MWDYEGSFDLVVSVRPKVRMRKGGSPDTLLRLCWECKLRREDLHIGDLEDLVYL